MALPDGRETLNFHKPPNDLRIQDIHRASQGNHATTYSERLNLQLNDAARLSQSIDLEECLLRYTEEFKDASDTVRHRILQDLNHKLDLLASAKYAVIQDPQQLMNGRRTHRRGGQRQLTGAEIAERNLQKEAEQPTESGITIVDLTSRRIEEEITVISIEEIQTATAVPNRMPNVEPRRSNRTAKRRSLYEGQLTQPGKCRKYN